MQTTPTQENRHYALVAVNTPVRREYTYGIPDDSDAWAVAKHNAIALGDIAIERASLGQVGADGVILIDS